MRFKPGQEVVYIMKDEDWGDNHPSRSGYTYPKFNEICVVMYYTGERHNDGSEYLVIQGYIIQFTEDCFEPIVEDSVIAKQLESISEPVSFRHSTNELRMLRKGLMLRFNRILHSDNSHKFIIKSHFIFRYGRVLDRLIHGY